MVLSRRSAFTLIELLVVIAIIAILSVVVILTLNPAELLRQSRDSNRIADMDTLTHALGIYGTDIGNNIGSSSVIYLSMPDPTATSTAGDQCQGLGLPSLGLSYTYHCTSVANNRNVDGTGWIPVNFNSISSGAPIGSLPVDPTNSSSSHLYYSYTTNGTQYEITSAMESQKYKPGGSSDATSYDGGTKPSLYERGTSFALEPLDYGDTSLVGYWPLDENTGTIAYDYSGNNATGSWSGNQVGTNGYYSAGKIGPDAGAFDGVNTKITIAHQFNLSQFTLVTWIFNQNSSSNFVYTAFLGSATICPDNVGFFRVVGGSFFSATPTGGFGIATNYYGAWHQVVFTEDASLVYVYVDGVLSTSTARLNPNAGGLSSLQFGNTFGGRDLIGLLDDIRLYSRALSATEIQALYQAGK